MSIKRIAVTGADGMLGSVVTQILQNEKDFEVIPLTRKEWDLEQAEEHDLDIFLKSPDYVVNCAGIIKPKLNSIEGAIKVNSLFPHMLAKYEVPTIQIATDCVYDGRVGAYTESSPFSPNDAYGMTKWLGEVQGEAMYHLRCSIIGPKQGNPSLLEWFLSQKGEVKGFSNHMWNGITTLAFAKICRGIIRENMPLRDMQHIVPESSVSKYHLLYLIQKEYGKDDVTLIPKAAEESINRTLETDYLATNEDLWKTAGYKEIPTIKQLLSELRKAQITGEIDV